MDDLRSAYIGIITERLKRATEEQARTLMLFALQYVR